jgi:hypothetical protein
VKIVESYPFLKAALDDMLLASKLSSHKIGTPRHIVSLLYDTLEFILYEVLLTLDQDIYRDGQNTIGLNAAIALCKTQRIDLPLLGTIRTIQKYRGDAKHHAQMPDEAAFARIQGEFRIIASRLIHERFGQVLGREIEQLGLLPYHVALYESYRKYRTHNWDLSLRFSLGALVHKHRFILHGADDYSAGSIRDPTAIVDVLRKEIAVASYPPAPPEALDTLRSLPDRLRALLRNARIADAAETAGHGYAIIDEVLPGIFDVQSARRITERLVQPKHLIIVRSMAWSKWEKGDTPQKREAGAMLRELLKQRPDLVQAFGDPYYEEDYDRYWRWWGFAVFDGTVWHTFRLDDDFDLSLESGSLSEQDAKRREQVAELILAEFKRAARRAA